MGDDDDDDFDAGEVDEEDDFEMMDGFDFGDEELGEQSAFRSLYFVVGFGTSRRAC